MALAEGAKSDRAMGRSEKLNAVLITVIIATNSELANQICHAMHAVRSITGGIGGGTTGIGIAELNFRKAGRGPPGEEV
uniref:Uncharacterized protein n=1 Tax=Globodera rostochiensis TaxID=31243 RepID=A0A914IEM6_GLORO